MYAHSTSRASGNSREVPPWLAEAIRAAAPGLSLEERKQRGEFGRNRFVKFLKDNPSRNHRIYPAQNVERTDSNLQAPSTEVISLVRGNQAGSYGLLQLRAPANFVRSLVEDPGEDFSGHFAAYASMELELAATRGTSYQLTYQEIATPTADGLKIEARRWRCPTKKVLSPAELAIRDCEPWLCRRLKGLGASTVDLATRVRKGEQGRRLNRAFFEANPQRDWYARPTMPDEQMDTTSTRGYPDVIVSERVGRDGPGFSSLQFRASPEFVDAVRDDRGETFAKSIAELASGMRVTARSQGYHHQLVYSDVYYVGDADTREEDIPGFAIGTHAFPRHFTTPDSDSETGVRACAWRWYPEASDA